jgi:ferredoxin
VADSPGLGSLERAARVAGIEEVCRRHGVPILDLGQGEGVEASARSYRSLRVAREALEAPWLWNLAKWKTHTMMGLTLGVKNLFGCVPGKRKIAAHFRSGADGRAFARQLLALEEVLRPALTVLDGVVAMDGPGPSRGRPVARELLLASTDAPSLDWEAARLSGFDPRDVPTVRLCLAEGRVAPDRLERRGDPAEPMRFEPAAGSPCDFSLPGPLKRLLSGALSPAPRFDAAPCTGCGACRDACPAGALAAGTPPEFSQEVCVRCYCCQELCPSGAVRVPPRGFRHRLSFLGGRRP